jgi:hypothetical protein
MSQTSIVKEPEKGETAWTLGLKSRFFEAQALYLEGDEAEAFQACYEPAHYVLIARGYYRVQNMMFELIKALAEANEREREECWPV